VDLFHGLRDRIDRDPDARDVYERRVANRDRVLDVGGRNGRSKSAERLKSLCTNPATQIVYTDVSPDYQPDIVDDITDSKIPDASFDGIHCGAILEHVRDYRAAVGHLHRILKPGGEIAIYVPFVWPFHDRTDFHRFTFTEVARMMEGYSDFRICLADGTGYGGLLLQVLSFFQMHRLPRLWGWSAAALNALATIPLGAAFLIGRASGRWAGVGFGDFRFYYLQLHFTHGFCAWGRK
jgi:SAM-dependent methyltransferase